MKFNYQIIHQRLIRHLREWHRKLGIMAVFFILYLALTGIAINHSNQWQLDTMPVSNSALLDFYHIKAPEQIQSYGQAELIVTQPFVWLHHNLLFESPAPVVSAGLWQQMWLVATADNIWLFTEQGQLIDKLGLNSGLPPNITALCLAAQAPEQLYLLTELGVFRTDQSLMNWQLTLSHESINCFAAEQQNSAEQINRASMLYRSHLLSVERLLLDLHSGRIFGTAGTYLIDFVAIIMMLLSFSGLYIWLRYARARR
jgi:hypothetical protein